MIATIFQWLRQWPLLAIGILGSVSWVASSCWSDDLGLATESPFTLSADNLAPVTSVGVPVQFKLSVIQTLPIQTTKYQVSATNLNSGVPLRVSIGRDSLQTGKWYDLPGLESWFTLSGDKPGDASLQLLIRNQVGTQQVIDVGYTIQ